MDIQKGLFGTSQPVYRGEELIDRVNSCIEVCEIHGLHCFYVQHANKGILKQGSDGWNIHPRIKIAEGAKRFYKDRGDAFSGTGLGRSLKAAGIERVVIAGLTTHGCIRATCRGSLASGFETILLSDCHSSYHAEADKLIEAWNEKFAGELAGKLPGKGGGLWSSRDFITFLKSPLPSAP